MRYNDNRRRQMKNIIAIAFLLFCFNGVVLAATDRACNITTGNIWIDFWGRHHDGEGVCRLNSENSSTPIVVSPLYRPTPIQTQNGSTIPVQVMPTGVSNTVLIHPVNNPYASPTPVIILNE